MEAANRRAGRNVHMLPLGNLFFCEGDKPVGRNIRTLPLGNLFLKKETSYPSPAMRLKAPTVTKTWLVNCALAEDAPDHIGTTVGAKSAQRNLTVGQHNGLVISCSEIGLNLSLYILSVAS